MRLPPWLAGLLIVVVLALVWWAVSGGEEGTGTAQPQPSPSARATPTPGAEAAGSGAGASEEAREEDWSQEDPSGGEGSQEDPSRGEGSQQDAQSPDDAQDDWLEPRGTDTRDWDDIDACLDDELPATMVPVVEDIFTNGPYDYDRDGITFHNYEGFLPDEERGYYREFTVETPGLDHRGPRRIVTGGGGTDPEVWYYTDDHYESFCEFAP